jgi:hypothetical protein
MLKALWTTLYPHLRWLALAVLIIILAQAMPFDVLGIAFAGDLLTYFEVAAAFWLAAQVTRVKWIAAYARYIVPRLVRRARVRARRASRRIARLRPPSGDDGRPRPGFAFA